jgi:hypothetical protein
VAGFIALIPLSSTPVLDLFSVRSRSDLILVAETVFEYQQFQA